MTIHTGRIYSTHNVTIGPPDVAAIAQVTPANDVADDMKSLFWAQTNPTVYYFSIYKNNCLVGQIYLHDIDIEQGEAMIGYHLFQLHDRGQGIGRAALALLQHYVIEETDLQRLIIITGRDNSPSRIIATKCGFEYMGGARENPEGLVVYTWVRRHQ